MGPAPTRPVEKVNWYDAVTLCNSFSLMDGLEAAYTINGADVSCNFKAKGYRLPTEAEWEYAAKGGSRGVIQNLVYAGSNNPDEVAWYVSDSGDTTHPVAQKKANILRLYDMAGNVWEWCWDWAGSREITNQLTRRVPAREPIVSWAAALGVICELFAFGESKSLSAPNARDDDMGFRLARSR